MYQLLLPLASTWKDRQHNNPNGRVMLLEAEEERKTGVISQVI